MGDIFIMNWNKYPEHIPNDDQSVLVWHSNVDMIPHKSYYYLEIDKFFSLETYSCVPINVTHWMPLPEPPKE